jgi:hypothetical protein
MSLEKIYVTALKRLTRIAQEVENRQAFADEAAYPNRCFTREQHSKRRIDTKQMLTLEAGGPTAIRVRGLSHVKTPYCLEHAE